MDDVVIVDIATVRQIIKFIHSCSGIHGSGRFMVAVSRKPFISIPPSGSYTRRE